MEHNNFNNDLFGNNPLAIIVATAFVFVNALFGFIPLPQTYEGKILQAIILAIVGYATTRVLEKIFGKKSK